LANGSEHRSTVIQEPEKLASITTPSLSSGTEINLRDILVAFFYCDYEIEEVSNIFGSVIKQVVLQKKAAF
jgi:hypothetical protein